MCHWLRRRKEHKRQLSLEERREKYQRLNKELAELGSSFRWIEVIEGEWYNIGTMQLDKPFPKL